MAKAAKNIRHDDLFKRFLNLPRFLRHFLRAFLSSLATEADLDSLEYIDKEHPAAGTKRRRRTGDLLVKTRFHGREAAFLIHVEHQSRHDAGLLARMAEYAWRDYRRYRLPVYPVVILSYRSPAKEFPACLHWEFAGEARPGLDISCAVIQLSRLSAAPYLKGENLAGLALAACMKLEPSERVNLAAWSYLQTLRQNLTEEERGAMMDMIYAYLHLNKSETLQISDAGVKLGATQEETKNMVEIRNPFVMLGEIQGEIKGKIKGEYLMLKRQLTRKLGPPNAECESLMTRLNEDGLLSLDEAQLYFSEASQLEHWLREAQTRHPQYFQTDPDEDEEGKDE